MKSVPGPTRRLSLLLLAAFAAALPAARAAVEFSYAFAPAALIPDNGQLVDGRFIANPGFSSITAVTLDIALEAAPGESMWLGDLYATLTHGTALEDERVAVLLNRPGRDAGNPFGSSLGSLSVTLDDSAATHVFSASSPTGSYRPDGRLEVDPYAAPVAFSPGTQTLSALNGAPLASGRWSLLVADTSPFDAGRLASWTLRLTGSITPGAPLTITDNASARFTEDVSGDITLTPGASVEFTGAMTGTLTSVSGSIVRLGPLATLGTAPFTLVAGATLSGNGAITGPATILGQLSPGNSPGILTFTAGLALTGTSVTTFELAGPVRGTSYDGIDLTTSGQLGYGGTLSLQFSTPVVPGTHDLFNRSAPVTQFGDFTQVSIGGTLAAPSPVVFTTGTGWTVTVDGHLLSFENESGDLVISLIPEPAAAAGLLGLLALALVVFTVRPARAAAAEPAEKAESAAQPAAPVADDPADDAEVFRRAFWRQPAPDDKILDAIRIEEFDDQGRLVRWRWFIVLEPGPALRKWLFEENPFGVTPVAADAARSYPADTPDWFPDGKRLATFTLSRDAAGTLLLFTDPATGRLHATDSGRGFAPGHIHPLRP